MLNPDYSIKKLSEVEKKGKIKSKMLKKDNQ